MGFQALVAIKMARNEGINDSQVASPALPMVLRGLTGLEATNATRPLDGPAGQHDNGHRYETCCSQMFINQRFVNSGLRCCECRHGSKTKQQQLVYEVSPEP